MTTKQFYLLCLISVTFVGGMFMLLLWRQIKLASSEKRGMLFISLSMFSWTLVGMYKYYDPPIPSLINAFNDRILSSFSNLLLCASVPYFPNVYERWRARFDFFRKPEKWLNVIFVFFSVVTIVFTVLDRNVENDLGKKVIIILDALISLSTVLLVSVALYAVICRFWTDKLLQHFILAIFIVFGLTQLVLPGIAVIGEPVKSYYLFALVHLLVGVTFFNFIAVAYFGLVTIETKRKALEEQQLIKERSLRIVAIHIGFNREKDCYSLRINFQGEDPNDLRVAEMSAIKLLQPFANWIVFALARKHRIKLIHPDLSTTKFRMVECWNKEASIKLTQEMLFSNDSGQFEFRIEPEQIQIEELSYLYSKYVIREGIIKHEDSFRQKFDLDDFKGATKSQRQENMVKAIFDLNS
jgi:hypothetical protein